MKTREILSIVALSSLGLCLLCGLAKLAMKNPKKRGDCDKACGLLLFVGLVLIGVSQLLEETTKSSAPGTNRPGLGQLCPQGKCQSGLVCSAAGDLGVPICRKPSPGPSPGPSPAPGVGQQCTGVGSCRQGLKCDMITDNKGVCVKPPPAPGTAGGPCLPIGDGERGRCAPDLACLKGICVNTASVLPGENQPCTKQGECLPGLKCTIVPGLEAGTAICMKPPPPPGVGQQCTGVGSCRQGLKCDMITDNKGVCVKPPSPPPPPPGTAGGACLRPLASNSKPFCPPPLTCFNNECM